MTDDRRPLPAGSTLLVDRDGVVADNLPRLCTHLREEYGHDVDPADVDDWAYDVPGADGHVGTVISELMTDHPEWYLGGMAPMPGVADALESLREAGGSQSRPGSAPGGPRARRRRPASGPSRRGTTRDGRSLARR